MKPSTAIRTDLTIPSNRLSEWAKIHNGATTRQGQYASEKGDMFVGTITNAAAGELPVIWTADPNLFAFVLEDYRQTVFDLREAYSPLSAALQTYAKQQAQSYFTNPDADEEDALRYVQAQYAAKSRTADCKALAVTYRKVCHQSGAVLHYLNSLRNGIDIGLDPR